MTRKHPLITYARKTGTSMEAIAEKAGCSRMTLYRVMKGENATVDLLSRISNATGGKVPVTALLPKQETAA